VEKNSVSCSSATSTSGDYIAQLIFAWTLTNIKRDARWNTVTSWARCSTARPNVGRTS
jgi:hypothetical protein